MPVDSSIKNPEQFSELGSESVKEGELYLVTPDGAVTSTGGQWLGAFKKGAENKLVIYFYGGGVSVDDYTAKCGFSKHGKEFFYFDDMSLWKETAYNCFKGAFGSDLETNPFKDWSTVLLPYTTGDFHIGTGAHSKTLRKRQSCSGLPHCTSQRQTICEDSVYLLKVSSDIKDKILYKNAEKYILK